MTSQSLIKIKVLSDHNLICDFMSSSFIFSRIKLRPQLLVNQVLHEFSTQAEAHAHRKLFGTAPTLALSLTEIYHFS